MDCTVLQEIMIYISTGLPRTGICVTLSVEYALFFCDERCGIFLYKGGEQQRKCRSTTKWDAMEDHIGWSSL